MFRFAVCLVIGAVVGALAVTPALATEYVPALKSAWVYFDPSAPTPNVCSTSDMAGAEEMLARYEAGPYCTADFMNW